MKPAFSVLLFTVLSGAGLGACAWVSILDLAARAFAGKPVDESALTRAALAGWILTLVGLGASTLHLANPRNVWRSASRWRTSWLSREAIASIAFAVVAAGFVAAGGFDAGRARSALAAGMLVTAWSTIYCTAMIYASLKPIPQWHTWRVPLSYALMAHASGALVVIVTAGSSTRWLLLVAIALFVAGALAKIEYWRFAARAGNDLTLARAIGVGQGVGPPRSKAVPAGSIMAARLLDTGHSRGTFLTREFGVTAPPRRRQAIRVVALLLGFAVPAMWLALADPRPGYGIVVILACIIGLIAERWLFFAEARHTVRLYHGETRL